ncbi:serine hydrolase [Lysinibacillus sp. NPDC047702]|uniref:serine hydrolase n=1 Tax=unclassified Lysinibacillus TaxID=2636778 RepID=UPI003D07B56F
MNQEIEKRIERIVNGLLKEGTLKNQYEKATLTERLNATNTPGVSIAVINNYEIEWACGFGVKECGKPEPVTTDTLFQAASVSKPIFATVVMKLIQDGKLDLDEDVNNYLTSWKVPANGAWQPAITLRQLLSHTAGLTVDGFPGYLRNVDAPSVLQILDGESSSATPAVRVNIMPGTQFRYSGGGTTVAQQAVSDYLDKSFPDIMHELLLGPLQMDRSTYEQPLPEKWHDSAATAHPWKSQPVQGKWYVYPEMAAAGLWTTPSDLARVGLELQLALKNKSGQLFSADIVKQMLTHQVENDMGIGFFLEGDEENTRFSHGGWNEGFVSQMMMYKNHGMGAVIMLNSNEGDDILREIERAIAREYNWPGYFPNEKIVIAVTPEILDTYVGEYVTPFGLKLVVTKENGILFMQPAGQAPIELYSDSDTKFFMKVIDTEVTFETVEDKVTGLVLLQSGQPIPAEKMSG